MFKCTICGQELGSKGISSHLRRLHGISNQEYYDKFLKKEGEGICPICHKETKFDTILTGYRKYCSTKCLNLDPETREKIKNTSLERYGVACNLNQDNIKDKAKKNSQSQEAKEKRAKTNQAKYGVSNVFSSSTIQEKIKQTNLDKYGVEYTGQSEQVKAKIKQTEIDRYGTHHTQLAEVKAKTKATNRIKYGVDNPYQNKEVQEKAKATNQERYGVDNVFASKDIQEKIQQTNIEKYGTAHPLQNPEIRDKMLSHKADAIAVFEKENNCTCVQTLRKQYGTGWLQNEALRDKIVFNHNEITYVHNKDISKITEYIEELGSHLEKDIYEYVKSIYAGTIIQRTRKVIPPQELDIYLPDKKLAIEVNGKYYHSLDTIPKDYHFNKSKQCEKQGIRLIHIYEWEWLNQPEKIKQLLNIAVGKVSRIYARNCEVREITNQEAKPFNEQTHLQGHRPAQVTYGLFYKDELVQLMSFSKTRYNRNLKNDNEWEIIRGCPGSNNIVIGGVSKLFKHFIDDYKPAKVFSYCDFNKFDGKSYEAIGMTFAGYTGPNKWWLLSNGNAIPRNPKKYQELKGHRAIYGSGSKKYIYCPIE